MLSGRKIIKVEATNKEIQANPTSQWERQR